MNVKKAVLVAGVVTGVGLAGVAGLGVASAATDTDNSPKSNIIEKLAAKFNLNKDEVAAVFEEERTERETERQQQLEERLTRAVEEGKLTEEQKAKIIAKLAELRADMQTNREAIRDKTKEEMRANMEQKRTALEQWATENNVPLRYLHFGMSPHGHGPGPKGDRPIDQPLEANQ